jgi:hypothetical protein
VQPHGVVEQLQPVEFELEITGVFDLFQVRELALEVAEDDSIPAWRASPLDRSRDR